MEPYFLIKGIAMGATIAAPLGPIGLLCIRRTLDLGPLAGLLTGLGAATADAIYGTIAAFGLTAVSDLLTRHLDSFQIIGGLFLCYLGLKGLRPMAEQGGAPPPSTDRAGMGAYVSALFLTLTNPMTILVFAAVFSGLGLANAPGNNRAALALVAGIWIGSCLWWFLLSMGAHGMGQRISHRHHRIIQTSAGLIILGFGLAALVQPLVG
ncbi:MAG: LysE family translocator [Desulfobacterales bacterium]|nr:LysE family translocator [Desulfobacterales bacterium]